MFNRFADGARRAVVLAQEEAREAGDRRIGATYLLLGVAGASGAGAEVLADADLDPGRLRVLVTIADNEGLDAEALASVGIDLDTVRANSERSFGAGALGRWSGARVFGHLPFTRPAKSALEGALRAAVRLGDREIDSGHVLLGVLGTEDTGVRRVLADGGVDPRHLAADVERRLRDRAA